MRASRQGCPCQEPPPVSHRVYLVIYHSHDVCTPVSSPAVPLHLLQLAALLTRPIRDRTAGVQQSVPTLRRSPLAPSERRTERTRFPAPPRRTRPCKIILIVMRFIIPIRGRLKLSSGSLCAVRGGRGTEAKSNLFHRPACHYRNKERIAVTKRGTARLARQGTFSFSTECLGMATVRIKMTSRTCAHARASFHSHATLGQT